MAKGEIILIPFPFTDLPGNKLRPAVILIETPLDLTVSFITTQLHWQEATDILLTPTNYNGIKVASLIRLSKIATIDKKLSVGTIGYLTSDQIEELNQKLKKLLQLN
jgi:mRNA interferase MazF